MAYENFIPEIWSKKLMVDRPKEMVFKSLTHSEYSGEIKDVGDQVKITGIGRPTIRDYTKGQTLTMEYLADDSQTLKVDQAKYFDFAIDDIEAHQAAGEIKSAQLLEARRGLAETCDYFLSGLYSSACTTITETELTSSNVISTIAAGVQALYENNVPANEQIALVVSPAVATKIMLAQIIFDTDNSQAIAGRLGRSKMFINTTIYVSNNLRAYSTGSYCMALTKKAIAFVEQIVKTEAYRPQTTFADAVKGLHVYGGKVIRPKDLVTIAAITAAESGI